MAKRLFLFMLVNLLVVTTISIVLGLLGVGRYFPKNGLTGLAVICLVWGFAGSLISLALSRVMAKWFMGVQVIPPNTSDPRLRELVAGVHELAQRARLPEMPQVGIYESPELNAFATGPSRSRALVAVSTGLLNRMQPREVAGVLGHEIAHIANGDMVTMTLVQGVINAFVLFLSRVLAFVIGQALRSRDDRDHGGGWLELILAMLFQVVLSILGSFVVCWF
jgi:heat shock protein HtpX